MVGLIIGKQTENLKSVAMKSNTRIFIQQKNGQMGSPQQDMGEMRTVEVVGQKGE